MPKIYYVRYSECTDVEPEPGFYIDMEEDRPWGPFLRREDAEEALERAEEVR